MHTHAYAHHNVTDRNESLLSVVAKESLGDVSSKNHILKSNHCQLFHCHWEQQLHQAGLLLSDNEAVKKNKKKKTCDLHRQFQKPILREALAPAYPSHSPGDDLKPCSGLAIMEGMKMYHVHCDLEYIVKK